MTESLDFGLIKKACKPFDFKKKNKLLKFWVNMVESQVDEAKFHIKEGKDSKVINELADCIIVTVDAFLKLGLNPETVVRNRIETRILGKQKEIEQMYINGDGHKYVR